LHEEQPLHFIYEGLRGTWSEISDDWKLVKNSIEAKKTETTSEEIKIEIQSILKRVTDSRFPESEIDEIKQVLKKSSPWSIAKNTGKAFVPSGEPMQACNRLCSNLAGYGLFVVEVGELERFVPSVGGHGPAWVNAALEKNLLTDPELELARKFVRRLI